MHEDEEDLLIEEIEQGVGQPGCLSLLAYFLIPLGGLLALVGLVYLVAASTPTAYVFVAGCVMLLLGVLFVCLGNIQEGETRDAFFLNKALQRFYNGEFSEIAELKNRCSDPTAIETVEQMAQAIEQNNTRTLKNLLQHNPDIAQKTDDFLNHLCLTKAHRFWHSRQYNLAHNWYLIAYERSITYESCMGLGLCCFQFKEYEDARKLFQQANSLQPSFPALYNQMLAELACRHYAETLRLFKEIRRQYPDRLAEKKKILAEIPADHLTEVPS